MPAAVVELTVEQGAYWSQQVLWKDSDDNPVNLEGWTARMQVRKSIAAPGFVSHTPVIELTTENGRITLGGVDGTVLLEVSAEDTAALPATATDRKWVYDLELVPSDDHVVRLMRGHFVVSLEVTRPDA